MAKGLVDDAATAMFRDQGYLVLRQVFDPSELSAEVDDALERGLRDDGEVKQGSGGVEFRVVVMMCERTPVSLALLDALAVTASKLLGRPVLPGRAKGTRYFGSSGFHADSDAAIPSLSFVAYLEPLDAASGALRVIPRSHREDGPAGAPDAVALVTNPGDVIVFDEHLTHGSVGGVVRRQWRVDFTVEPRDGAEETLVYESYARLFDVEWDAGDDVDGYPSYGPYWQTLDRPWTTQLGVMGVYELAARHAAAVRARERRS
ncbi:MAG: phytanoyl-CoA dioxygenase family protein [Acidimicrobiales bacterium]